MTVNREGGVPSAALTVLPPERPFSTAVDPDEANRDIRVRPIGGSGVLLLRSNLTYWKQGGFLDWQRVPQKRDWLLKPI